MNSNFRSTHARKTAQGVQIISTLVLILVLVVAFAQVHKASASADMQARVVTKKISLADQQRAANLWTHDAIASAEALEMPTDSSPSQGASSAEFSGALDTVGFSTAPGKAATNASAIARKTFAADWSPSTNTSNVDTSDIGIQGTSQVFTSYSVNTWAPAQTIYPHVWIGRLTFSTAAGSSSCSATAISGNNFVTAAHCVYDTTNNVWYSNWAFTPAYRNGSAPYGTFYATYCTVLTNWVNLTGSFSINGWTKYDVAVCSVGTNAASQTLNTAVGWAGRQWNYGYTRNFFTLGYPARNSSDALLPSSLYLRTCTAESFQQTTDTLGMGCNWGRGISGGPWLIGYAPGVVSGAVNSVNSGLYIGQSNMYGIRFSSDNIVIVCNARAC